MPNGRGALKLPAETEERLKNMGETIEEARAKIRAIEKVGIDTTELHNKLDWAENTRDVLLSEFGTQGGGE